MNKSLSHDHFLISLCGYVYCLAAFPANKYMVLFLLLFFFVNYWFLVLFASDFQETCLKFSDPDFLFFLWGGGGGGEGIHRRNRMFFTRKRYTQIWIPPLNNKLQRKNTKAKLGQKISGGVFLENLRQIEQEVDIFKPNSQCLWKRAECTVHYKFVKIDPNAWILPSD